MKAKEDTMMTTASLALLALLAPVQTPMQPAKDLFMHSAQAPGIEIRFVDYHWQPALFEAMEKGDRKIPEATRNWVVVRVILNSRPLSLGDERLSVGNYGLVLWPNLGGKGMELEMRRIDMREVYPDVNAIAPAPNGQTVYRAPVRFEESSPEAPRFDATLVEADGKIVLTIRYGNRKLPVTFVR
jgi:hypothetical protein